MIPPLKIALVTDTFTPQINGVARTLARTADAMRARGHDLRVYAPADPGAASDPSVVPFSSRPFWAYPQLRLSRPAVREMVSAFTHWGPDVVHVATPFGVGLAGRAAARRLRLPLVSSYHTSLATYAKFYGLGALSGIGWWYLKWFHNSTALTLCPTQAISDELAHHGFRNLAIWGRGVDTSQFNPTWRSESLRASWGAGPKTTVIAYVGRLAAEKGLDVALGAMRRVAGECEDVVFVVAGDGPYEVECRRRAPDRTVFTGRIEGRELSATYASADIFVFPSVTDTFGNVVQEAMASGLAVVAADVPQTREVVGDAGVLAPPASPDAFAVALRGVIQQPGVLTNLRERAMQLASSRSWDAVFDGLEARYARMRT